MKRSHYLLIGLLMVVVTAIVACSIFWKFKQSMYPLAPSMPPIVSQTTEEILSRLELQLKNKAPQILTNLQPGLSAEEISKLERQFSIQLPEEIKALYQWRNGFNQDRIKSGGFRVAGPMPGHNFMPLAETLQVFNSVSNQAANATLSQRLAFNFFAGYTKSWVTIFDDGAGDGYFFDPTRKPSEGALFYHFMETGKYIFFPSAKNLFAGLVKGYEQDVFAWKQGANGAGLDEDFNASAKIWNEFGVNLEQQ